MPPKLPSPSKNEREAARHLLDILKNRYGDRARKLLQDIFLYNYRLGAGMFSVPGLENYLKEVNNYFNNDDAFLKWMTDQELADLSKTRHGTSNIPKGQAQAVEETRDLVNFMEYLRKKSSISSEDDSLGENKHQEPSNKNSSSSDKEVELDIDLGSGKVTRRMDGKSASKGDVDKDTEGKKARWRKEQEIKERARDKQAKKMSDQADEMIKKSEEEEKKKQSDGKQKKPLDDTSSRDPLPKIARWLSLFDPNLKSNTHIVPTHQGAEPDALPDAEYHPWEDPFSPWNGPQGFDRFTRQIRPMGPGELSPMPDEEQVSFGAYMANVRAGERILTDKYSAVGFDSGQEKAAMQRALSNPRMNTSQPKQRANGNIVNWNPKLPDDL